MAIFPIPERPLPLTWQNSVVDIEPTSRYGPEGTPDMASVNTTLVFAEPLDSPVDLLAPGHYEAEASVRLEGHDTRVAGEVIAEGESGFDDVMNVLQRLADETSTPTLDVDRMLGKIRVVHRIRLEAAPGQRMVRFFTRLPVIKEPDGHYKFSMIAPVEFAELAPGGDFTVSALLPRDADYGEEPRYRVEMISHSKEANPQVFGNDETPPLGGRKAVSWYWKQDPEVIIVFGYL